MLEREITLCSKLLSLYLCMYTYTFICVYICICVYMNKCVYTCVYIHIHIECMGDDSEPHEPLYSLCICIYSCICICI